MTVQVSEALCPSILYEVEPRTKRSKIGAISHFDVLTCWTLGNTALMAAISTATGSMEVVDHLLQHGADVNAVSDMGFTPLMWAAR